MALALSLPVAPAAAQQLPPAIPFPTPSGVVDGLLAEVRDPAGSPAGADLPDCRPAPEHPRPVLLVHGITSNRIQNWVAAAPYLANRGFCVYTFTYGTLPLPGVLGMRGGLAPMAVADAQMAAAVADVRARTGAREIDVVGHSMGTVVANSYVTLAGGAEHVHTVVNVAGVMGGQEDTRGVVRAVTDHVRADPGSSGVVGGRPGIADIMAGSDRIRDLNSGGHPYAPGVRYTNIVTRTDETIRPFTRGLADAPAGITATNIVVQDGCEHATTGHSMIVADPRSLALIHNALSPERPEPVPCPPPAPGGPFGS